jgi:hypothetical protein
MKLFPTHSRRIVTSAWASRTRPSLPGLTGQIDLAVAEF